MKVLSAQCSVHGAQLLRTENREPPAQFFFAQQGLVQPGGHAGFVAQQAFVAPGAPPAQHADGAVAQLLRAKAAKAIEASARNRFMRVDR